MISPKICYVVVFLWLVLHGVKISERNQLKLLYATTNVLRPPCSHQSRRVKKHVTLLSVNQITHGLMLIQRSSLPLMLTLLANDVELNSGPMTLAEELEHSSSAINNSRKLVRKSLRCLYWKTRSLFSSHKGTNGEVILNYSNLQDFIYSESIHVVFLTETWLSEKHFDREILPLDYNVFRVGRKCRTGGGVLIAIKLLSFTETRLS